MVMPSFCATKQYYNGNYLRMAVNHHAKKFYNIRYSGNLKYGGNIGLNYLANNYGKLL
jgi:hypothetical protein